MSSSANSSRAVNTSPADGNDVKPTSHLISPLPALSSLTASIVFLINLLFSPAPFSLCPLFYLRLTLSPDLSFTPPLTPLPSFLSPSRPICNVHSSSPRCSDEHFSFHHPPFFFFTKDLYPFSSVWCKLHEYVLLFPPKGQMDFFS